ncbi:hypothetical protein HHI36_019614 [Cryptolaemus montrouzieri]|uniref:Uncharacterized protein n=1 Tax=Cryptolaemus montrouzieri TaxID=559131 RepID=A0ABD2N7R2_9CUCU
MPKKKGLMSFLKRKSKDEEKSNTEIVNVEFDSEKIEIASSEINNTKNTENISKEMEQTGLDIKGKTHTLPKMKNKTSSQVDESAIQTQSSNLKDKKKKKSSEEGVKEERGRGILNFLSRRSKSKEKERKAEDVKDEEEDMSLKIEDTKLFLSKEIEMYHDVKSLCPTENLKSCSTEESVGDKDSKVGKSQKPTILKYLKKKIKGEQDQASKSVEEDEINEHIEITAAFLQNELRHFEDVRPEKKIQVTEIQERIPSALPDTIDSEEFTAFDFIKEEVDHFETTKLPSTQLIESSFKLETEIEEIDGEAPKEIIKKRIIISEKLRQLPDNVSSDSETSGKILEQLMGIQKELKDLVEQGASEHAYMDSGSTEDQFSPDIGYSKIIISRSITEIPSEKKIDVVKAEVRDEQKISGSQEKIENVESECTERMLDLELARGDVVEDVSPLESKIKRYSSLIQEKITDLDDISEVSTSNVIVNQDKGNLTNIDRSEEDKGFKDDCSPSKKSLYTKLNEKDKECHPELRHVTADFIKDLKVQYNPDDNLQDSETSKISIKEIEVSSKSNVVPYVTSPTMVRRTSSQRVSSKRTQVTEIPHDSTETIEETTYLVTDPDENLSDNRSDCDKRKPLFRLESDEDDFVTCLRIERRDSAKSNILEILSDDNLDNLLCDLQTQSSDSIQESTSSNETDETMVKTYDLSSSKYDIDIIEQKLRDLGKALDTLEKPFDQVVKDELKGKKLKRVERKFERMASEVLEPDTASKQADQSAETKQFQQLVSQLSNDEVISFQKEYNNLWDDYTFSKSDELDSKTPDSQADILDLPKDISCRQLTEASQTLSTNIHTPQPMPRQQKPKELFENNQESDPHTKQISPVRDDLLDEKDQAEEISYQDKKKFWETISKEPEKNILENTLTNKRKSIHEISQPPIPKPRGGLLFSYSVSEISSEKLPVEENTETKAESHPETNELTCTESPKVFDEPIEVPKSEYQASFVSPLERGDKSIETNQTIPENEEILSSKSEAINLLQEDVKDAIGTIESKEENIHAEMKKSDSTDSDTDGPGQNSSLGGDNAGYISDCGDVEQYISDSEIEDRVPQIRERQMSVFVPPSVSQRTRYERSASLPTEDLYEVSARSTKLRKQYYEEQIKKEMIKEQLTFDLEDENSPERKSIGSSTNIAEFLEKDSIYTKSSQDEANTETSIIEMEEEQSSFEVPAIPQTQQISYSASDEDIVNACKIDNESVFSIRDDAKTELDDFKDLTGNELSSKEIHVDKSEIEKSEKVKDKYLDGLQTSLEVKSISKSPIFEEAIPEITFSLSGKQRRISEESDEYAPKDEGFVTSPLLEQSEIESDVIDDIEHENENSKQIGEISSVYEEKYESEMKVSSSEREREPEISKKSSEKANNISLINQPEENVTNTVWEVSVESETLNEEKLTSLPSIPTATKRLSIGEQSDSLSEKLMEKEEDLSSDVRDESDLGSEIHQDHSDSSASDKIKSESHSDMKRIILESLHQQKVDPEEAKIIANSLIEEIESEIQKVENINRGIRSKSESTESEKHVTEYLKELAESKGLDQREVELVESVLERRQRQILKLTRGDTQASSMEITDEDLRHSEGDLDYRHILEQQMDQLEAEYSDNLKNVYESLVQDQDVVATKISEDRHKEDHQNIEGQNMKKDIQMKVHESLTNEKSYKDTRNVIIEEDETLSESITEDVNQTNATFKLDLNESTKMENDQIIYREDVKAVSDMNLKSDHQIITDKITRESAGLIEDNVKSAETFAESVEFKEAETVKTEIFDKASGTVEKVEDKKDAELEEFINEEKIEKSHSIRSVNDDGGEIEKSETLEQTIVQTSSMFQTHEESIREIVSKDFGASDIEKEEDKMKRTSSSDSKSSASSAKSPEDIFSTCSSSRKMDSETCPDVVLRKSKVDSESTPLKPDRKSGVDLESYSSSGESYYHSFEVDSKSRPCSSDIEGIVPTASSEYESALNSQELSARSQLTSGEYHTAVSSLSSKESMASFESESSGNLASIEASEVSETLVPTNSDLEGDMDIIDQQILGDTELLWPTNAEEIEDLETNTTDLFNELEKESASDSDRFVDIPSKMKRSYEMTFQPEPKVLSVDSPHTESNDLEEKFGTSLDDGSVLSVSLSSTSSIQLKTVIELSKTESGGLEESLTTSALSDHMSLEDVDSMLRSTENIAQSHTSTSTVPPTQEPVESVTILSASFTDNGKFNVCSQVTTETAQTSREIQKISHDELKKKGHRRQESNSFIPSLIHSISKSPETQLPSEENQMLPDYEKIEERTIESSIRHESQDKAHDLSARRQSGERRDSHGKSSTTSSEKSSFEEAEAEAAFNMVAHISPVHKIKQICPIIEDIDAEKNELEAKELAERERIARANLLKDASPGSIPDIKVTEHMAPLDETGFRYPELEMERIEQKQDQEEPKGPESETPVSISSKSSEDTDQGREYTLEERNITHKEETYEERAFTESKSEITTVVEKTMSEEERATDSPNSDSFELVEKPDIIDDFVVIEEVGKEACEMDSEGKSVTIQGKPKRIKKHDEEIDAYLAKSDPTPLTKMTELKYFPNDSNEDLEFDFEDSPPQKQKGSERSKDYGLEYDRELEANRKWIEQQFHGDQAAMAAAGYGYEMEFERGPLEDIKEEDINDIDLASSRIGSLGSQKESGGSLGSIKDSYSSTPEYDVLAGRKYFTKSGEHDDISMSSLQEFENLERAMSLETKKFHHGSGSQDSSSNGSFKTRYYASKGQGDDISVSSLKEFEGLEKACIAAYKTEIKVKEEEEMLSQIEEAQESLPHETQIQNEIVVDDKKNQETDEEDYEKRMFEIDEIIRQAQNNVERFIDLKEADKTESLGRGDSVEEVSKVPDLDLDAPVSKKSVVKWNEDDPMVTSTDSLDCKQEKPSHHNSTDSLDQKSYVHDIMTASTDSIEFNNQVSKSNITTDSMDVKAESSHMVLSDSLELAVASSTKVQTDSLDEDDQRISCDPNSSDTGKDFSSSVKDDGGEHDEQLHELMLGSTDSLEPTSSAATHATYQYETDSVFSGSFTSGGSNTMVSSTDTIDPTFSKGTVDIATAVRKVWFDEETSASGRNITAEYFEDTTMPYVTEVIEPCDDPGFSHTIHRRVELPPEVNRVTFHGKDAEQQLQQFIDNFGDSEEVHETEEIDADGNVHIKKVVQKRYIIKSSEEGAPGFKSGEHTFTRMVTNQDGNKTTYSQQFEVSPSQLTALTKSLTGDASPKPSGSRDTMKVQATRRRPLRYDISVDDQTEVDPREHDWRFDLNKDDQSQESTTDRQDGQTRQAPVDQHQLSEEMKELLKEMEQASKK